MSSILIGALLLISVYLIPTDKINENIFNTPDSFSVKAELFSWAGLPLKSPFTVSFGTTDKYMMQISASNYNASAIFKAMLNPIDSQNNFYPRYWHGYTIFLKPLLYFFDVNQIKFINAFLQIILLAFVSFKIYKIFGLKLLIAFLITIIFIDPVSSAICLAYSPMYYIMLFAVMYVLKKNFYLIENQNYIYFFLIAGIVTAFFDFLTYPLITLGIPLIFYVLLNNNFASSKKIYDILKFSIYWSFGYASMWSGKWVISYLLTGYNTFANAFNAMTERTQGFNEYFGQNINIKLALSRITQNFNILIFVVIFLCIMAGIIFYIARILIRNKYYFYEILPLILISLYPFGWYLILQNHSVLHYYFTNKILSVSLFAMMCAIIQLNKLKGKA